MNTRTIERGIKLVTPITIVLCAFFAAKTINDFVAARYIEEAQAASPAPAPAPTTTRVTAPRTGEALTARNMFCSECESVELAPGAVVASAGDGVPMTALPLRLTSTNVSTVASSSFASIVNTASGHKGAYWTGHSIPGAGAIERVSGRYVDFHNPASNRLERVGFDSGGSAPAVAVTLGRPSAARPGSIEAEIAEKVRKVNDSTWEIDRTVITTLISNPTALRGVRVLPAVKDGKPAGFRVARLAANSPAGQIGIASGDIIRAANGTELNSPDVVLGLLSQVQTVNRVKVTVERGGKMVDLNYLLR